MLPASTSGASALARQAPPRTRTRCPSAFSVRKNAGSFGRNLRRSSRLWRPIASGLAFASGPMQHATEAVTVLARRRVDVDRTAQVRLGLVEVASREADAAHRVQRIGLVRTLPQQRFQQIHRAHRIAVDMKRPGRAFVPHWHPLRVHRGRTRPLRAKALCVQRAANPGAIASAARSRGPCLNVVVERRHVAGHRRGLPRRCDAPRDIRGASEHRSWAASLRRVMDRLHSDRVHHAARVHRATAIGDHEGVIDVLRRRDAVDQPRDACGQQPHEPSARRSAPRERQPPERSAGRDCCSPYAASLSLLSNCARSSISIRPASIKPSSSGVVERCRCNQR